MAKAAINEDQKLAIELEFAKRQKRLVNPAGSFDKQGRFYLDQSEIKSCCQGIRQPSKAFPYSQMLHARTKKHCQALILEK